MVKSLSPAIETYKLTRTLNKMKQEHMYSIHIIIREMLLNNYDFWQKRINLLIVQNNVDNKTGPQ